LIRRSARCFAAAVLLTAAVSVRAQEVHLLDVPFLPQSESLCGGAAAAMVMRYWGTTNVYAETFADLVDPAAAGIHADDLLRALRARGWGAVSFRGDPALVQQALRARRPAIVLIEDRPGRFHYVVIVGWSSGRVIAHDPARAPFRVLDERAFMTAWQQSGYWTLVPDPPAERAGTAPAPPPVPAKDPGTPPSAASTACDGMVDEGVRLANSGDVTTARLTLEGAAASCPRSAAPWRELAGLHALAGSWGEAASDARRALDRDGRDAHAARILATALYLQDDADGALDAWNRIGEPVIDLVNIIGLERTRYAVAARAMGVAPQQLLTRAALLAARRRLAELPSAQTARVTFRPAENGRAQIEAVVLERPLLPTSPLAASVVALRAATDREVAAAISSPSGGGETWTAAWRWWEHRPRIAVAFETPAPFGGIWGIAVFRERQTYADGSSTIEESRSRAEFHLSDWTRTGLRWETAIGFDQWRGIGGRALSIRGGAQQRFAADRGSLDASADSWIGGLRTWRVSVRSEWRSSVHNEGGVWIVRAGEEAAPRTAPLGLWPGAGTGQGRPVLLRAHPLLHDGIIRGVFGPQLTHGGAEWRRWLHPVRRPLRLAPAFFVDLARGTRGLANSGERWQADVGGGLRIAVPGSGALRIDVARGLRDGRSAVSVGWGR
jgi:hypothetical protein